MPIIYKDNEQIVIEIKKLLLENKISQREIAEKLNIKPQGLTKILNKKNFGFDDAKKLLDAMGYNLLIDFEKNTSVDSEFSTSPDDFNSRRTELLAQLDQLKEAPAKPKNISEPKETPRRESLDEKLARLCQEHSTDND